MTDVESKIRVYLSDGQQVQIAESRVRRAVSGDLLALSRSDQIVHIGDAIVDDDWLSAHGEEVLREHGLIPSLFSTPHLANIYPPEDTLDDCDFIEARLAGLASRLFREPEVLDVSCGVGRLLLPLVARGRHVDGIDVDRASIRYLDESLRSCGFQRRLFVADAAHFETHPTYDAAFSAMNSLRYLATRRRVREHLCRMRSSIASDGFYLVNMSFGDSPPGSIAAWSANGCEFTWQTIQRDRINDVVVDLVEFSNDVTGDGGSEYQDQYAPSWSAFLEDVTVCGWRLSQVYSSDYVEIDPSAHDIDGDLHAWLVLR